MKLISTRGSAGLAVLGLGTTAALVTGCGSNSATSPQTGSTTTAAMSTTPGTASATGATPSSASSTHGTGNAPTTTAAAGTPRCHTRDLSGSITVQPGSGAAGSVSYNITITNGTTHSCTVYGYPGLLLLDAHHAPVPTDVTWVPQAVKHLITLNPGASASSAAHVWHNATVGDNTATSTAQPYQGCQPTSVYIEITPPDETTHLVVPVVPVTQVCGRGTMDVTASVAGTTGANVN